MSTSQTESTAAPGEHNATEIDRAFATLRDRAIGENRNYDLYGRIAVELFYTAGLITGHEIHLRKTHKPD